MKFTNLAIGAFLTWLGGDKITVENSDKLGWVLLVAGVVLILSAFTSNSGSGSGWGDSGGFSGDSGGGDCGGGD